MKIEDKREKRTCTFEDIKEGDLFGTHGSSLIFIKTAHIYYSNESIGINCIPINGSRIYGMYIESDERVIPLKGTLIVEYA